MRKKEEEDDEEEEEAKTCTCSVQGIMDNFYFDPRGKIAIFPKDSVVDNFYSAPLDTKGAL